MYVCIEVLRNYCISVLVGDSKSLCCRSVQLCVWCPFLLQVRSKVMQLQALKYSSDQMKLLPDVYHQVSASADGW